MTKVIRTSPLWRIFLCSRLADLSPLKHKDYILHVYKLAPYYSIIRICTINVFAGLSPRKLHSKEKVLCLDSPRLLYYTRVHKLLIINLLTVDNGLPYEILTLFSILSSYLLNHDINHLFICKKTTMFL